MKSLFAAIILFFNRENIKETVMIVGGIFLSMLVLNWRLLVSREVMVTHDSIIWYGLFSYFADGLQNGFFPLWNPYMNCGEPFFLNVYTLHLLDPSTLLLILTGKIFSIDLLTLYHWDLFLRYLIFICGAYMFFRYIAENKESAFIAFLSLTFSSLFSSYLRQHAFLLAFYLFPWLLLFILKFLEKRNSGYLIVIAFLLGIGCLSYHSMFLLSALFFLLFCILVSKGFPDLNRRTFMTLFKDHKMIVIGFLIFLFLIINLCPVFLTYKYDVIPTVRMFEAPAAASSYPADFLVLVAPYVFITHFFNWDYMSESFLYIGLFPLLLVFLGLQFSKHKYKWGFILASVILIFLMMGKHYFLYPVICKMMPFFKIIRNTHTFGFIFIFYLTYFVCIGSDVLLNWIHSSQVKLYRLPIMLFTVLIVFMAWLANAHICESFPSLIRSYHILYGYNAPLTDNLVLVILDYFFKAKLNILLFIITCACIFSLLMINRLKSRFGIKYLIIVIFIAFDLLLFHYSMLDTVLGSRKNIHIPDAKKPVYENRRMSMIEVKYPFYGFSPAMMKTGTAYTQKRKWITTHFYETKDFFDLSQDRKISEGVKDVLMGISVPKLRLFSGVIVLPRNKIKTSLAEIDAKEAERLLFIEESPPSGYASLEKDPVVITEKKNFSENEDVKVKFFDANNLAIEVSPREDGILYYSDGFAKAWKVFVDGKQEKVYKANLAFKAVFLAKGFHRVHFIYDPSFYIFGLWCYAAGLLIVLIIAVGVLKKVLLGKGQYGVR